jgi:hypothetical protein
LNPGLSRRPEICVTESGSALAPQRASRNGGGGLIESAAKRAKRGPI